MINLINYILIGALFMFLIEYLLNSNLTKKYSKTYPNLNNKIGSRERLIGILFWPMWVIIFLFYFLKNIFE